MLKRRGFTLIELMVGIVLLGLVGLIMARLLVTMLRVTTAQIQMAGAQSTSRTGVSAIPLEFREIGFDTLPQTGGGTTDTDLEAIAANRITFRAMRGTGITCDMSPSANEFKVRQPQFGLREPLITDTFRIFIENEVNLGTDDQWVSLDVTDIDDGDCAGDPAWVLSVNRPKYGNGDDIPVSAIFVGGPIRWYERMEYGPVIDASGRTYVGARSLNLGENTLTEMIGPLPDSTGFSLTYYAGDGTVLDPTAATNRIKVRSIGITLTGTSTAAISLAGATNRARSTIPVFTRVALRNNLRETAP